MHHTDPSRTQALSLQLVEKIFQLYEQNEKLVNFRNGEPNFYSRPNQRRISRACLRSFLILLLQKYNKANSVIKVEVEVVAAAVAAAAAVVVVAVVDRTGVSDRMLSHLIVIADVFFTFFRQAGLNVRERIGPIKSCSTLMFYFIHSSLYFAVLFTTILVVDLSR